jgi:hypothetical protein
MVMRESEKRKEGRWVAIRESVGLDLLLAAPDLLKVCERQLADLVEARDDGRCSRSRDERIAELSAVLQKAKP